MEDKIIFKSGEEYYYAEKEDLKNNTFRLIELGDYRLKLLEDYCKHDFENELIITIELWKDIKFIESFERNVRHATTFAGWWAITWEPSKLQGRTKE